MPVPLSDLRADLKTWIERNAPELLVPRTKAQRVLDTVNSYAELAYGWDPTKEGDYKDFAKAITQIIDAE